MVERSYRGLLWTLALLGVTLDLGSKYAAFGWLYQHHYQAEYARGACDLIPGVFELNADFTGRTDPGTGLLTPLRTWGIGQVPKVNHGALFGFGREYVSLANGVFAVISFLAALAIIYWSTRPATAHDGCLCAALGLILGGTLGNLYDRIVFNGVRDFLHFYWFQWPVFNVADCCLVCGAFLLLAQAFFSPAEAPADAATGMATVAQPVEAK